MRHHTSQDYVPITERETLPPGAMPAAKDSEVRIKLSRASVTIDLVTADLTRDPRSEDFIARERDAAPRGRAAKHTKRGPKKAAPSYLHMVKPPSTSTVRALK